MGEYNNHTIGANEGKIANGGVQMTRNPDVEDSANDRALFPLSFSPSGTKQRLVVRCGASSEFCSLLLVK